MKKLFGNIIEVAAVTALFLLAEMGEIPVIGSWLSMVPTGTLSGGRRHIFVFLCLFVLVQIILPGVRLAGTMVKMMTNRLLLAQRVKNIRSAPVQKMSSTVSSLRGTTLPEREPAYKVSSK